jgi:hypothetical protein
VAGLSASARRRALQLRLKGIQYKLARVQQEIADLEGGNPDSKPSLFDREPAGLRSLRDRLDQLKGIERGLREMLCDRLRTMRFVPFGFAQDAAVLCARFGGGKGARKNKQPRKPQEP